MEITWEIITFIIGIALLTIEAHETNINASMYIDSISIE